MSSPSAFIPILPLARRCHEAGGRALLVGGAVRDLLLERHGLAPEGASRGREPLDLDVEVHGLEAESLEAILAKLGPVNLVGKAFSVWRTRLAGVDVDVSLPRRDNRVRPGHRGIRAVGDPHLGLVEAARRRDLTINAIAYDPLSGELVDPFNGEADLLQRRLRAVDPITFTEDPLRALRVPQFAARFRFDVDPALQALCATVPVQELPPERIHGELRKLLMLPQEPSWGLRVGVEAELWHRVHPALELSDWGPVYAAVDRAVPLRDSMAARPGRARAARAHTGRAHTGRAHTGRAHTGRAETLMLCALLHRVPPAALGGLLDRLDVHSAGGFSMRRALLPALARAPGLEAPLDDGQLRLLAREAQPTGGLRLWLAVALALGRDCAVAAARAEELGVGLAAPDPLVRGRHLRELGMVPGPAMGQVLERLYVRQLREGIQQRELLLRDVKP